ncbi:hypothetical protein [Spiroplasma culicicola]|uniref:ABC transporter permease n=1 Tax=Spiroplasma culicicola AES-1 TaxID=1276246 RepID=W6A5V8_9MOLU|nr:hypothetical protein [Spiroplasma culicicola]AHI52518.1 ABC transporter permease [Spiroplasma culicicola AES-1]
MNKRSFKKLLLLELKMFLYNPLYVFMSLILSPLLAIIWFILKDADPFVVPSTIAGLITTNATLVFFNSLVNKKKYQFERRLINKVSLNYIYFFASLTFNLFLNIVGIIIIFVIACCNTNQILHIININWIIFIYSLLIFWLTTILITYIVYCLIESEQLAMAIITMFYVVTYNLMGCTFPFYAIVDINWINAILYIFLNRYSLNLIQVGYVNALDLNYIDQLNKGKYNLNWQIGSSLWIMIAITAIIVSCLLIIVIIHKAIKRSYIRNINKITYIKSLKKAKNIEELTEIRQNSKNFIYKEQK